MAKRENETINSSGKPVPPSGCSYGFRAYGGEYQLI